MGSSSLPPTMGDAATQMRQYANFGHHSPRHLTLTQTRESKSNPASATPTPPVSPYRHETGATPAHCSCVEQAFKHFFMVGERREGVGSQGVVAAYKLLSRVRENQVDAECCNESCYPGESGGI